MGAKKENTYENYVHADTSGSSNAMKMYLKEIEAYKILQLKKLNWLKRLTKKYLRQKKIL